MDECCKISNLDVFLRFVPVSVSLSPLLLLSQNRLNHCVWFDATKYIFRRFINENRQFCKLPFWMFVVLHKIVNSCYGYAYFNVDSSIFAREKNKYQFGGSEIVAQVGKRYDGVSAQCIKALTCIKNTFTGAESEISQHFKYNLLF